jgi:two-component system CheB/CheR fusion protein
MAPYRTADIVIDGVVVTFVDITEQKRILLLEESLSGLQGVVDTVREPFLVLDAELRVISSNKSFYDTFRVAPGETEGRLIYELGNGQWNIPALRELLENVLARNEHFHDYIVEHDFPDVGRKKMLLNARRIYQEGLGTEMILLAMEDMTGK